MDSPEDQIPNATQCPLCGQANECPLCRADAFKGPCWCEQVKIREGLRRQIPAELKNKACICRACVTRYHRLNSRLAPTKLQPGDFYFDAGGMMVFTASYHRRRGWCCGSGCRHCPYGGSS